MQKYNTSLVVFSSSLSLTEFVLCISSAIETEGLLFQFRSFRGYLRVLAPSEIEQAYHLEVYSKQAIELNSLEICSTD